MAAFGSSQDLAIYHDGSNSYLGNATGDIIIENSGGNTSNQIYIRGKTGVDSIRVDGNGATYIYDQGTGNAIRKFSTSNTYGTILSNTTDNASFTNTLLLTRRGYEASGLGVIIQAKGGGASSQNGLNFQVSTGSAYTDRFRIDSDGIDVSGLIAANGSAAGDDGSIWCNYGGSTATRNGYTCLL